MGWLRSKHTLLYDTLKQQHKGRLLLQIRVMLSLLTAICFLSSPFILQNTTTSGQNLLTSALTHLPYQEDDNRNHDPRVHTDVFKEVVNTLILASTEGNIGQLASPYTSSGFFP